MYSQGRSTNRLKRFKRPVKKGCNGNDFLNEKGLKLGADESKRDVAEQLALVSTTPIGKKNRTATAADDSHDVEVPEYQSLVPNKGNIAAHESSPETKLIGERKLIKKFSF